MQDSLGQITFKKNSKSMLVETLNLLCNILDNYQLSRKTVRCKTCACISIHKRDFKIYVFYNILFVKYKFKISGCPSCILQKFLTKYKVKACGS